MRGVELNGILVEADEEGNKFVAIDFFKSFVSFTISLNNINCSFISGSLNGFLYVSSIMDNIDSNFP